MRILGTGQLPVCLAHHTNGLWDFLCGSDATITLCSTVEELVVRSGPIFSRDVVPRQRCLARDAAPFPSTHAPCLCQHPSSPPAAHTAGPTACGHLLFRPIHCSEAAFVGEATPGRTPEGTARVQTGACGGWGGGREREGGQREGWEGTIRRPTPASSGACTVTRNLPPKIHRAMWNRHHAAHRAPAL